MKGDARVFFASRWKRRRRPELPGVLIPEVQSFTRRIQDWIIAPGGQPEFMGIFHPGISGPTFRDNRPKRRVGDHIDPGGWRGPTGLQCHDVFPPVLRKAAQAVGEPQRWDGPWWMRFHISRANRIQRGNERNQRQMRLQLVRQRSAFVLQINTGDRLKEYPVLVRHLLQMPDKKSARPVDELSPDPRGHQAGHLIVQ